MVTKNNYSRKICFSTNLSCNLNCVYCYEHKIKDDNLNFKYVEDNLVRILSEKTSNGTLIKLHGGEPFLVFNKLRKLCDFLWAQNFDEDFLFRMTTNGTLVHGEIQKWLIENRNRVSLKLSLDGNKEAHNLNRPNSYDKIDIPFFLSTWPNIELKMTISPGSLRLLCDSIIHLHSIGFTNISTSFAELVDWSSCNYPIVLAEEMDRLSQFYLAHPDLNKCSLYNVPFRHIYNKNTLFHPCTVDVKEAYDFHTGKTYPCHLYFESVCGKKTSEELCNIDLTLEENRVSKKCKNCIFLNICHTCYVANYISRGATYKRDEAHCMLNKVRYWKVAHFYFLWLVNGNKSMEKTIEDYQLYCDMVAINKLIPKFAEIERETNEF